MNNQKYLNTQEITGMKMKPTMVQNFAIPTTYFCQKKKKKICKENYISNMTPFSINTKHLKPSIHPKF